MIVKKRASDRSEWYVIIGLFILFALFLPQDLVAKSAATYETDYEGEILESDSRLVKAMKIGMYEFVTDDEEIDIVGKWVKDGGLKDQIFEDDVLSIMKENCTKCHSKTSTMSKAVPDLPLTTFEEIKRFTITAPTDKQCLECHAEPALKDHTVAITRSLFMDQSAIEASVHQEQTCVKCHVDIHPQTDTECQDVETFKSKLAGDQSSGFSCQKLKAVNCESCHQKETAVFQQSAHFNLPADSKEKAPVCADCHGSHEVQKPELAEARGLMLDNCGSCHQEPYESYFKTYHGKSVKLGSEKTAQCIDCHGSHNLLPAADHASTLHPDNIQKTCSQCHENVNANFAGFIPHADYTSSKSNPELFISFWAMTGLLIGTFFLFGIHTLLWLYRSLADVMNAPATVEKVVVLDHRTEKHVRRFRVSHSILHLMIIVSFLSLALTGMALKFPDNPLFSSIVHLLGGPHIMGTIHRIGASITFLYAVTHLFQLGKLFFRRNITVRGLLKEEYSLIPLPRDLKDLKANLLYFIGKGPKPTFGRWTYWEKFDYMAVFWGITIIGSTGLILWFPTWATQFLPGWVLNVATIIHSDEALLAAGFIFTFHFFHSHLRPENFPLDPAIFTQRIPLSRFKEEREREYKALVERGELENHLVNPPSRWFSRVVLVFGMAFLMIGLIIVSAISYSLLMSI